MAAIFTSTTQTLSLTSTASKQLRTLNIHPEMSSCFLRSSERELISCSWCGVEVMTLEHHTTLCTWFWGYIVNESSKRVSPIGGAVALEHQQQKSKRRKIEDHLIGTAVSAAAAAFKWTAFFIFSLSLPTTSVRWVRFDSAAPRHSYYRPPRTLEPKCWWWRRSFSGAALT